MPKVYIVQEVSRWDAATKTMVPIMDFRNVLPYGEPVICLPGGNLALAPGPTIDSLRDKLRNFTDDDYIVSVGDPSAIFMAAMIVGERNNGRVKLLKWDKRSSCYIKVEIDVFYRTRRK